ncbi:MAG: alpha/beta hydrolase family protein, partial [Solirubrobacterales bacterium]
ALWLPDSDPPWPGVLIVHGAGSRKENHADFARLANANGWAALAFDARGHGESEGEMSPGAVADVARMAGLLAAEPGVDPDRVIARGSSMGGFLALHAAAVSPRIAGVIAICPAGEDGLRRALKRGELEMRVGDVDGLRAWLAEHDLRNAVELIGPRPLIFLHAEGDEQIPYTWSQELYERAIGPRRLILAPGGHHRSVQHDPELQTTALRWIEKQLG